MNTHHCRSLLTAVVVICCSCLSTEVGSRYVKSEQVSAANGKTLTVTNSESKELAGTKLEIGPGALPGDKQITLELGTSNIVTGNDTAAGVVAVWGPPGTIFAKPVE